MRAHEEAEEVQLEEVMSELDSGQPHAVEGEVQDEDELPAEVVRCQNVIGSMESILQGQTVDVERLDGLGEVEQGALTHLVSIVRGFTEDNRFVFAEDRLADLQQVLMVLQPILSVGVMTGAEVLRAQFDQVVDRIDDLRQELIALDEAEAEARAQDAEDRAGADGDDQEDPDALEDDLDRMKRAQEAAAAKAKAKGGPAPAAAEPARASTLQGQPGEPAVERPAWTSTLTDEPPAPGKKR